MKDSIKKGIENSNIFAVFGTQNFFDDIPKEQVAYAKKLNKPFRVLVHHGVVVPPEFKFGVEDYKELETDLRQTLEENIKLFDENLKLKDENASLWAMMDEITNSDKAAWLKILEELDKDTLLKGMMISNKKVDC